MALHAGLDEDRTAIARIPAGDDLGGKHLFIAGDLLDLVIRSRTNRTPTAGDPFVDRFVIEAVEISHRRGRQIGLGNLLRFDRGNKLLCGRDARCECVQSRQLGIGIKGSVAVDKQAGCFSIVVGGQPTNDFRAQFWIGHEFLQDGEGGDVLGRQKAFERTSTLYSVCRRIFKRLA